jgi:hypothetical protein
MDLAAPVDLLGPVAVVEGEAVQVVVQLEQLVPPTEATEATDHSELVAELRRGATGQLVLAEGEPDQLQTGEMAPLLQPHQHGKIPRPDISLVPVAGEVVVATPPTAALGHYMEGEALAVKQIHQVLVAKESSSSLTTSRPVV